MTNVSADGRVEFRFFRPQASHVFVAGDFNEWQPGSLTMKLAGDGWWTVTAPLPPGEYRFRYVADGRWFTDFAAHGVEAAPGGWNGVIVVPKDKAHRGERAASIK